MAAVLELELSALASGSGIPAVDGGNVCVDAALEGAVARLVAKYHGVVVVVRVVVEDELAVEIGLCFAARGRGFRVARTSGASGGDVCEGFAGEKVEGLVFIFHNVSLALAGVSAVTGALALCHTAAQDFVV